MTKMSEKSPFDSSPKGIVPAEGAVDNGTLNMNEKEDAFKPSIHVASKEGKRERAFELSLSALVTGMDALDNKFREKTQITSISSEEAVIWLRSQVPVGGKVDISLDIPKTLILENSLKLHLTGTVLLTQPNSSPNGKKQLVSLRLDKKFKLLPIPPSIN
jgi:hypothetical protein